MVKRSSDGSADTSRMYETIEAKVVGVKGFVNYKRVSLTLVQDFWTPVSKLELALEKNDSPVRMLVAPVILPIRRGDLIRAYVSTARKVFMPELEYGPIEGVEQKYTPCSRQELKEKEKALKIELLNSETNNVDAVYEFK